MFKFHKNPDDYYVSSKIVLRFRQEKVSTEKTKNKRHPHRSESKMFDLSIIELNSFDNLLTKTPPS